MNGFWKESWPNLLLMPFTFSPYLFEIGGFGLRVYSLMYLLGLGAVMTWMVRRARYPWELIVDYALSAFLFVVIGGRIGYILFYEPFWILHNPVQMLKIWEGGMSFHGGLIAGMVWTLYFLRKRKLNILRFTDALAIPLLIATGLGRIGNFFNGEIWGGVTNVPWCFQVPGLNGCRHPAQLYQMITDWLFALVLFFIVQKNPRQGTLTAGFLIAYSLSRIFNEVFFREPSWIFAGLSAGTWLSLPMLGIGATLLIKRKSL